MRPVDVTFLIDATFGLFRLKLNYVQQYVFMLYTLCLTPTLLISCLGLFCLSKYLFYNFN